MAMKEVSREWLEAELLRQIQLEPLCREALGVTVHPAQHPDYNWAPANFRPGNAAIQDVEAAFRKTTAKLQRVYRLKLD